MDIESTFREAQSAFDGGDLQRAAALCGDVIAADDGHHRAHHMLGAVALQRNEAETALGHLNRARDLGNEHPILDYHLGLALLATGDAEAAATAIRKAAEANPGIAEIHCNLGRALLRAGYRNACIEAFGKAAELAPDMIAAWVGWGRTLLTMRRFEDAREKFAEALALAPDSADALNHGATADIATGRPIDAIDKLRRAHEIAPGDRRIAERLARMLSELSDFPTIERELRDIAEQHAASAVVLAALAAFLERRGNADEANELAERALAADPESAIAHLTLARIARDQGRTAEAREHLDRILEGEVGESMRVAALKTLAAVLDKEAAYDDAFEAATAANAITRELPPEVMGEHDLDERIARYKTWVAEGIDGWSPPAAGDRPDPVFFVGFPRSGTTLIEAMLDAHPRFVTAGERAWLLMAMRTLGPLRPETWGNLDDADIRDLRAAYWHHADRVHGDAAGTHRVVDKMPLNIVDLPFAKRLFPDAKVLVALRDPRDCLISAYMQNFTRTPEMRPFLDIEDSARFYADVMGLWQVWRERLGLDWLEVRYEDLVVDTETCFRGILDHLGEPWDDAVLRHHQVGGTARGIRTPSAQDAGKAVHGRARGRWRHYETHLAPVMPTLQPFIEAFGYADNS